MWWSRGDSLEARGAGTARARLVPAADTSLWLARLACGAAYRLTLQAHNAVGASPHSAPLLARTRGDSEYSLHCAVSTSHVLCSLTNR